MAAGHMLRVENLKKTYTRGVLSRTPTFSIEANFTIEGPRIVGVMGPNGSGKTTLFELITGSNLPTSGRVLCLGQDIHKVRYRERERVARHYHQSYQVRSYKRRLPNFMLDHALTERPLVHLFDEPQFNTQDGYIGFMLDFFRKLKSEGCLVFLCLHPNEPYHIELLEEICDEYIFINQGQLTHGKSMRALAKQQVVGDYLGTLVQAVA